MNDLNISKNKAIEILQQRLAELNQYPLIEDKVWCSRTSQDVKAIFKGIDGLSRSHEIESLIYAPTGSWLKVAKGYINTYIDFIKDHYPDPVIEQPNDIKWELLQTKQHLTEQRNNNEQLQKKLANIQDQLIQHQILEKDLHTKIDEKQKEIDRLTGSMWQIEDTNLKRLWKVFSNLKLKDQIAIIGVVIAIASFAFFIGQHFAELSNTSKSK